MVRCQECNSKVAENDLFCPYCGMLLKTAPLEQPVEVVPVEEVSVNATTEPNMADVEVPGTLDDYARTSDNVKPPLTSEYAIPDDAVAVSEEIPVAPHEAVASPSEEPSEVFEEAPVEEAPAEEIPFEAAPAEEIPVEAASSALGADDGSDISLEDLPPVEEAVEAAAPTSHDGEAYEEVDDEAPTVLGGGVFDDRAISQEQSIARPLEELEEVEPPMSMFDSVRIMESKPRPDEADTRIQGVSDPLPEPPPPAILSEQTNVQPKPYTEPNLGTGGDTDGKRSAKLKPLTEGTILNNRYEIVRKIGGGGMGAVYLASDNNLGGVLRAVKEMVQSHIEEEQQEKAINDFKRESMILSTLDHPSIPTIYDYFYEADEGRFYLVMKYISGGDLASRLRSAPEGRVDEKSVTQWAVQITDVLDYLHNQPSTIVYRDLKPSNIMIDGNSGRIMLIDFGIARSISQKEEKGVTAVGTMGYAPPELFSGNVEPRSDIYSLGSTMFHLLTGADPQSNPLLIFDFQKNPRPRQINSQLSDQIERIMMRAVEYNADARFGSAGEMKAVLEEHLNNLRDGNVTYGVTAIPASVSLENQSVFCGFCGQRIVATDLFCAFCGAKQPIAQQGVHSEIYTRSAPTAKLIIEGTSELTTPAFSLQKDENLVGRRDPMSNIFPEVDLSKYDPQTKISRRHARIWRDGSNFLVEDLGSSNGTILASAVTDSLRLIPHKPHILTNGDKLKVGDTTLHFLIG